MEQGNREHPRFSLFGFGLVLKAIEGALEIVGAFIVLIVPSMFVVRVIEFVTAGELAADPNDFVAIHLRSLAHSFAVHSHYFIALYLVLHGVVKLALVLGVAAGKRLAYPLFILALGVFGSYEAYRGIVTGNLLLDFFAVLDTVMILLTAYEYRAQLAHSSSGY
ncbi:DUF2127 domain-containing protein [Candidatus Kaiserbacteria bacterium]|nr:DUF2127 domain-containing protein [Candidatus Kaiserbacteria bacterium]